MSGLPAVVFFATGDVNLTIGFGLEYGDGMLLTLPIGELTEAESDEVMALADRLLVRVTGKEVEGWAAFKARKQEERDAAAAAPAE